MASIDIRRSHSLGRAEAKTRAANALSTMSEKYGLKGSWNGDKYEITAPAKGVLLVSDNDVHITIDLPFLLRPMKGKIESRISDEFERVLK